MAYVSTEQYNYISQIRDTINGELNRIAVTDDINEINDMHNCLLKNIERYAKHNRDRINGVYEPERKSRKLKAIDI